MFFIIFLWLIVRVCNLFVRSVGDGDVGAASSQHGGSSSGGLVPALRCRGAAQSVDPSAGPMCRANQRPEEFARSRERVQLRHGRPAGCGAPVSTGYSSFQGQGGWVCACACVCVCWECYWSSLHVTCGVYVDGGEYSGGSAALCGPEQSSLSAPDTGRLATAGSAHDFR